MRSYLLASIVLAAILSGCRAAHRMSGDDRATFRTAAIGEVVADKEKLFLFTPGSDLSSAKAFAAFLDKNNISIEKIVRDEVEKAFRSSGKLTIANAEENAPATIKISILQYGFGVSTVLLSKDIQPVLWIKCDMVDSSGRLLWSQNTRLLPSLSPPIQTTWNGSGDRPRAIEEDWRRASEYLAKRIVISF